MTYTDEGKRFVVKPPKSQHKAKPRALVRAEAILRTTKQGADINDELSVLGEYEVQFGKYQDCTFRCVYK